MDDKKFTRGSEWRKWDLHIHTPASFHWNGQKFSSDPCSQENALLVDQMISALNEAEPSVFAIMDYWTFDGWFALKHRLSQPGSPKLEKTVFPGIELRLMAPMKGRLNAHVLFSDKIDDQDLIDFKSNLKLEFPGQDQRNLSNSALIEYARFVASEKLIHHGFDSDKVKEDDSYALIAGASMAELNCESYKQAIAKVKNNQAIGFMPFDTSDGLTGIKRNEHYAYVLGLFKTSPIFETRKIELWEAFSGIRTQKNQEWIEEFQGALNNIPRLAVSGSDAHCFVSEIGNNEQRGYGDFPSGKITWIKANPTFEGLQQAIKEPSRRSFIGEQPPKKKLINDNKSIFIHALNINKVDNSILIDDWLDKTELNLNYDLIAIIGNKGSGKSALADITALLGNSKQSHHFSFLKQNRFRGKAGEPAKHFSARVIWVDGQELVKNLSENPATENVELVKYIPQGHFEELCNAHVSGTSNAFEKELRAVIFSHADETIRLGALDFDQLIDQQENTLRNRLDDLRGDLHKINRQIHTIESQMSVEARKAVVEQIAQQQRLLDEHEKIKPEEISKPTDKFSEEQQQASEKLAEISVKTEEIKISEKSNQIELTQLSAKKKAYKNIQDQIGLVKRSVHQFVQGIENDSKLIGVDSEKIMRLEINQELIEKIGTLILSREQEVKLNIQQLELERQTLMDDQKTLSELLNGPQQAYQKYLEALKAWEEKRNELHGNIETADSLLGLKERLKQLDQLPDQRMELQNKRLERTEEIFDILEEQRNNREELFQPVQQLIQSNNLIRDEYKLQFKAELDSTPTLISNQLFSLVKQTSGKFRGEAESISAIKELTDKNDLNTKVGLSGFVTELHNTLEQSANGQIGINSLLRKDRSSNEVYDFLFGLEYLNPRYTLMFQDAHIEQLSPGQRGALLLIFYLLVDKGSTPIILDQPEENLDNETIVNLLVPVLHEAKQKRQIIMVTHNPNLAVVCDAEQIIHCEFDRKNGHRITYTSGAIESSDINKKVVDVLEGTMPAFENRRKKYH
jgi:ABC-type lipoprotein export system ATPase subunit